MKEKSSTAVKIIAVFMVSLFCALLTGAWSSQSAEAWDRGNSEGLVMGRIYQMEHSVEDLSDAGVQLTGESLDRYQNKAGFLLRLLGDQDFGLIYDAYRGDVAPTDYVKVYSSSSGLQGTFFGILALSMKLIGIPAAARLGALYLLNTALTYACMLAICLWIKKIMGIGWFPPAAAFLIFILSPFIQRSARNLYWVFWTMLLPMLAVIWLCEKTNSGTKFSKWNWFVLFLAACIRFMSGFEFVSMVMIAAELPAVYYLVADRKNWSKWLRFFLKAAGVLLGAFVFCILVWMIQNLISFSGTEGGGIENVLIVIAKRTGLFYSGDLAQQIDDMNPLYTQSLAASRWQVVLNFLKSSTRLCGSFTLSRTIAAMVIMPALTWTVLFALGRFFGKNFLQPMQRNLPFFAMAAVSLLGPLSWFFLASGHSYIHFTVIEFLWLLPVLPLMIAEISFCMNVLYYAAIVALEQRNNRPQKTDNG